MFKEEDIKLLKNEPIIIDINNHLFSFNFITISDFFKENNKQNYLKYLIVLSVQKSKMNYSKVKN